MSAAPTKEDATLYRAGLRTAAKNLETATVQLRLFQGHFSDDHSIIHVSAKDAAVAVGAIADLLGDALRELFNGDCGERDQKAGGAAMERLWNCFDVAAVCHQALQAGSFGDGRGITSYPVQGAMELVYHQLVALRRPLDRYLASVPMPRKVKAAA